MDSGSDKYLHKKFKKQLNVTDPPKSQVPDNNDKEAKAPTCVQEKGAPQILAADNNKDSVPNQSTNRSTSSSPPYTSSSVYSRSSISQVEDAELTTTITCISYARDRQDHADPLVRPFRSSVSEPTIVDDTTRTDQSSILEYPSYASSKEDEKDHYPDDHSTTYLVEKNHKKPGEPPENNTLADKTSGGKHVCPFCSLACSKPSVLQKHIRAHTNERPYPCDSCGFSFKTRSNLYKHCRSRTHANRVMGNKIQEIVTEMEVDPKSPEERQPEAAEVEKSCQEQKKPYKPRFHTAKVFFDNVAKENVSDNEKSEPPKRPNSDLLSIRINEVISKNNSIVNSTDPYLLKRRSIDNSAYQDNNNDLSRYSLDSKHSDEPLNLSNKNRKRCHSEVITEPAQKSLIKELLLKNLYADTNMQCPYCKMIFQTVTELELHKLRNCKGFTKSSARYNRSSSVNVASILTQNKNAFDSLAYPLKSPGPFLGKTRLVESDKNKSFSFDDNLAQTSLRSLPSTSDLLRTSQRYALSPLTIQTDREKKAPVKLFGGEVKIAHTSGETKSFKIDGKDEAMNYLDFGGKLSENRLVKSTLQSGGTVLTNKPAYTKQESPDVLRVYENNSGGELGAVEKAKFGYENPARSTEPSKSYPAPVLLRPVPETTSGSCAPGVYKYTNIMDFSQKAAKMLTPNLKQLNLTIPAIPVATSKFPPGEAKPTRMEVDQDDVAQNYSQKEADVDRRRNLEFAERQITLQQKMGVEPPQQLPLYNPVNLLVNGKVVRYVPGIPGPVVDAPMDMAAYSSNIISTNRAIPPAAALRLQKPSLVLSPLEPIAVAPAKKLPVIIENHATSNDAFNNNLRVDSPPKTTTIAMEKSPSPKSEVSPTPMAVDSAPEMRPPATETRKFSRPNSLALKPTLASMKTHHGLTPTVFNQILISPDTPRVAKKYNQHMIHGNYFTYLGLKSSTKSVYCTLNKTQPVYVPHFKKLSMYSEWRQQENKSERLYVSGYNSRQRPRKYTMAGKTSSELTMVHSSYKFVGLEAVTAAGKSEEQKSGQNYESNEEYTYARGREDSTRQQEHEAAYGLLSLSQKTSPGLSPFSQQPPDSTTPRHSPTSSETTTSFIDNDELVHVSKKTFARNKILVLNFNAKQLSELPAVSEGGGSDAEVVVKVLGKMCRGRPLSYPYTLPPVCEKKTESKSELKSIRHFQVIQNYNQEVERVVSPKGVLRGVVQVPVVKVNDKMVLNNGDSDCSSGVPADLRKRKVAMVAESAHKQKMQRNEAEVMDLSVPERRRSPENHHHHKFNGSGEHFFPRNHHDGLLKKTTDVFMTLKKNFEQLSIPNNHNESFYYHPKVAFAPPPDENGVTRPPPPDYDNSAMETLADVATQQEKLEKNSVAKNVATEFLKLATQSEYSCGEGSLPAQEGGGGAFVAVGVAAVGGGGAKKVNELLVKPEENKSCTICAKSFSKPSQLRLHMNIHYLERPFRCDSCSVGFRTRGQLQKHERSAGHHNKLSSSPALSSSEPRPFKCNDCGIAFRIHGHLAKHLRSKMHIMKLECLAKIPFGLYAELERSNSLLTEINTADVDQCLDSLKILAKKIFMNDPNKLNQLEVVTPTEQDDIDS